MDIGKNLQRSFDVYFKNFGTFFLACLVAGVLSTVTFGILAGPLCAGLMLLGAKLIREEKADWKEIFHHFNLFLPTLILVIMLWAALFMTMLIALVPLIGWIISMAAGPALTLIFMLAVGLVADQKLQPLEAVKQSISYFLSNPLMLWIYSLVIGIIAGIGALLFIVPVVLSMPIGVVGMSLAYQELSTTAPGPLKIAKRPLRIALITLGVLAVIGVICFTFGFGQIPFKNPSASLAEKMLGAATGEKVQVEKDRVQIGGVKVGAGLPQDFPKDFPLYPKAKITGHLGGSNGEENGTVVTLTSDDSAAQIMDYYVSNLQSRGWSVTTSELGEMKMVSFEKAEYNGVVTIGPNGKTVDIMISFTVK